jgi:hypothetical protein
MATVDIPDVKIVVIEDQDTSRRGKACLTSKEDYSMAPVWSLL